jgi:hypothetical protein
MLFDHHMETVIPVLHKTIDFIVLVVQHTYYQLWFYLTYMFSQCSLPSQRDTQITLLIGGQNLQELCVVQWTLILSAEVLLFTILPYLELCSHFASLYHELPSKTFSQKRRKLNLIIEPENIYNMVVYVISELSYNKAYTNKNMLSQYRPLTVSSCIKILGLTLNASSINHVLECPSLTLDFVA